MSMPDQSEAPIVRRSRPCKVGPGNKVVATCRFCSAEFEPTPTNIRHSFFRCRPCAAAERRAWVAKRKAAGFAISAASPEYHRAYGVEYVRRPERRAKRVEESRRRHSDPAERAKALVRSQTRDAIKRGKLTRQPCEVCGEVKVDAHHDDYSKPLEVRWLCRLHHRQHHIKIKGQNP